MYSHESFYNAMEYIDSIPEKNIEKRLYEEFDKMVSDKTILDRKYWHPYKISDLVNDNINNTGARYDKYI